MSDLSTAVTQYAPILKGATFVGIVGGVERGFNWFDGLLNDNARSGLSNWLKNVPGDEQIDAWIRVFPNLIDRVFGPKAISWRFILRSCVASFVAFTTVLIFFLIFVRLSPEAEQTFQAGYLPGIVAMILIINFIPDYFSLLISRWIVRTMAKYPRFTHIAFLLVLDVILILSLVLSALFAVGFYFNLSGNAFTLPNLSHALSETVSDIIHTVAFRIFMLTSLFTSVWVWLYVLSSVAIRILHKLRFIWVRSVPFLNVDRKPMQAVGRIAGLLAGLLYGAGLAGVWLYRHL